MTTVPIPRGFAPSATLFPAANPQARRQRLDRIVTKVPAPVIAAEPRARRFEIPPARLKHALVWIDLRVSHAVSIIRRPEFLVGAASTVAISGVCGWMMGAPLFCAILGMGTMAVLYGVVALIERADRAQVRRYYKQVHALKNRIDRYWWRLCELDPDPAANRLKCDILYYDKLLPREAVEKIAYEIQEGRGEFAAEIIRQGRELALRIARYLQGIKE